MRWFILILVAVGVGGGASWLLLEPGPPSIPSRQLMEPYRGNIIQGVLAVVTDASGIVVNAGTTDDTITMNQTTTGGLVGSFVELEDVASGVWMVTGTLVSSGAEGDPFSAAV